METILNKIIAHKKQELVLQKQKTPLSTLERALNASLPNSLSSALRRESGSGIIAEFKRRSPSKGVLKDNADVTRITQGYVKSGAIALSVLTDQHFFGALPRDLETARKANACPILRKEFIVEEYQVIESKLMGADAILLIAAVLSPQRVKELANLAQQTGLEVLLEIHDNSELAHINEFVNIVGVNNRNLNNFSVSIQQSLNLYDRIPSEFLKISESGIDSPGKLMQLQQKGFDGFLIGECFMKTTDPGAACGEFIDQVSIFSNEHIVYGF